MKKVKSLKRWGIFELNLKEKQEHSFSFAVIHPSCMECYSNLEPGDTDIECETLEQAISWVVNYK